MSSFIGKRMVCHARHPVNVVTRPAASCRRLRACPLHCSRLIGALTVQKCVLPFRCLFVVEIKIMKCQLSSVCGRFGAHNSIFMYERNYPCDSLIAVYFGVLFPPSPPASTFLLQKFTYLCRVAQAIKPRHFLRSCSLTRSFVRL